MFTIMKIIRADCIGRYDILVSSIAIVSEEEVPNIHSVDCNISTWTVRLIIIIPLAIHLFNRCSLCG